MPLLTIDLLHYRLIVMMTSIVLVLLNVQLQRHVYVGLIHYTYAPKKTSKQLNTILLCLL